MMVEEEHITLDEAVEMARKRERKVSPKRRRVIIDDDEN